MTEVTAIEIELLERERQVLEATPIGSRLVAVQRALGAKRGRAALDRDAKQYEGLGITAAARRLLKETARPMATREIADAIAARGVTTRSSKFVATIYSTLLNSSTFVRLGNGRGGRWALAEWNIEGREAA